MKIFSKKRIYIIGMSFLSLIALLVVYLLATDRCADAPIRTMQDQILSSQQVDLTGLRELQVSGGPIVHFSALSDQLKNMKKRIIIVDGLDENHGYFNGTPTTFYGYHREHLGIRHLIRRLLFTGTYKKLEDKVVSEKETTEKLGFTYKEIPISSRTDTPPQVVDEFINFVETLPETAWVHFHCRHGKGRTSVMLVMFDIIKNAPQVALSDIVTRQHLLGSINLFDTSIWNNGTYDKVKLERRKKFIEDFYAFICQRKTGGIQKWSIWRQNLTPKVSATRLHSKP
ncbi:MAG: hypothetical protein ACD_16C00224G0010 [uncultured bacterium]|nr:MAG: hypothetical protein ACD_16C00224G0010 [uncultured bacterium]OFW69344.1 MAG: hypothetical protein A2X70_07275 [Alphaproteobacteria bacterium GWC2_42_16]OFW74055.1 MAG: hypothetical protein A2Z80_07635 [Alphaproteobacteria bacterium GWA2_41_27]OFW83101.1 MAG: hypothetical protein A3E50_05725 [Alphaproteobacteria bacterium RIFCSPHIGHO2_12_FULL_42_100]OFW84591.1 MAG: hypothetical protein A2W06_07890 [Alphaproteobacteria bacterium RBG_16_42_14]OFW92018.1 MAG: hypothetical protein A3C41_067